MHVQSVLVEFECLHSTRVYSNGGLLFGTNSEYLLTTSNVLTEMLLRNASRLAKLRLKTKYNLHNIQELVSTDVNLKVVEMQHNKNIFRDFKVVMFFISQEIEESIRTILFDWNIDDKGNGKDILHGLPIFFISQNIATTSFDIVNFSQNTISLLNLSLKEGTIERLQNIFIESAPFGNRQLLDSYCEGIVSNVMGTNSCLFLTDCATVPGCEGAVIFKKSDYHTRSISGITKIPIGVVLSSHNIWKGDYLVLTVGASLQCILRSLINSSNLGPNHIESFRNIPFNKSSIISSVVRIKTDDCWGSAILYNKKRALFITNSHIVGNNQYVDLHWNDLKITCEVLFRTPIEQIYDLAILHCIDEDYDSLMNSDLQPAKINRRLNTLKGEAVLTVGYPLFDASQHKAATITSGHVMQISNRLLWTTCAVLPGSSGGGVFARSDGRLLGIMVCNARMEGVNYANVNMAVPTTAISQVLSAYVQTEDLNGLKRLSTQDELICEDWRFAVSKL